MGVVQAARGWWERNKAPPALLPGQEIRTQDQDRAGSAKAPQFLP